MSFKHLEDALNDGDPKEVDKYLEVFGRLQDPTKTVLGYTLDIATYLRASLKIKS